MITRSLALFVVIIFCSFTRERDNSQLNFFEANHPEIRYTGRIDFSNLKAPRFWQPGVNVTAKFTGSFCSVMIEDEMLYGKSHNYITIVIDGGKPKRIKLSEKRNTVNAGQNLSAGEHTIVITKDTEAGVGYIEFLGFVCQSLVALPESPKRKLEFIGDSITVGMENDLSETPCDQGEWYDQHNSWMSYGPIVARNVDAQWHISAVSGIGLIHSCCKMTITMPQVFDKINPRKDSIQWDFKKYQPDVVTVCLGQNDGVQDSVKFCGAYVQFIQTLRTKYPEASIVCLSSPMANAKLTHALKNYLKGVVDYVSAKGDKKVSKFYFSKSFNKGCGGHPDLLDHEQIADELTAYLKKTFGW